jgi:hypothetical protein
LLAFFFFRRWSLIFLAPLPQKKNPTTKKAQNKKEEIFFSIFSFVFSFSKIF